VVEKENVGFSCCKYLSLISNSFLYSPYNFIRSDMPAFSAIFISSSYSLSGSFRMGCDLSKLFLKSFMIFASLSFHIHLSILIIATLNQLSILEIIASDFSKHICWIHHLQSPSSLPP